MEDLLLFPQMPSRETLSAILKEIHILLSSYDQWRVYLRRSMLIRKSGRVVTATTGPSSRSTTATLLGDVSGRMSGKVDLKSCFHQA